ADYPAAVVVVGVVLDVALARGQHGELARVGGRRAARLARDRAFHADADVTVIAGAADAHVETVVMLLVDQLVGAGRRAEHVLLHPHGEEGLRVVLDVEDGAVVIGPDDVGRYAADHVVEHFARLDLLDADDVLAAADVVLGPRQQAVVLADFPVADVEVVLARGHRVDVQQHLLGGVHRPQAAGVDRVVLAGLEAAVVPPAAFAVRHRAVVLLDAPDNLLVQAVL